MVHNDMSGSAGNVVQAGNVGVINFGNAQAPDALPRQIPPPPDRFVNRTEPLSRIEKLSERPVADHRRPAVVAIHGMPGVGKTALLLTAAARLGARFPDGTLHADFGPLRHRGGAAVGDVVADLLRGLRVADDWIPAEFSGRVALFRSMTADARVLIVLDNVWRDAQVTSLLPNSPHSMVLAAGNHTLEELLLDGAVDVGLRSLDERYGVELLARMCQDGRIAAEPAQARALVALCDRLPLAVRVSGALLAAHPTWPVARLVDELSDLSEMLDELVSGGQPVVRVVFDLVYEDMPAATARVYRLLGLLAGPHFGADVVAAMAELPVRPVRRMLAELVRLNMVEERADDTYQLHRLVRLHALRRSEEQDTDAERAAVLRRALRWWLTGAVAADVAVTGWDRLRVADPRSVLGDTPVDLPRAAALDWLAREHPSLIGLLRAAVDHEWHDEAGRLFEALYAYYDNRQPLVAWIAAGELAVLSAQRSANKAAEARTRCQLARALQLSERFADAHVHLTAARALASDLDDRLFASTLDFTGNVCLAEGDYATALTYFRQALDINQKLGRQRGTALLSWLTGQSLAKLGRTAEALDTLKQASALMLAADAASLVPKVVLSIGELLLDTDQVEEAGAAANEARELARASGLTAAEADALVLVARVARRSGDVDAERTALRAAESAFATMGSPLAARIHAESA